VAKDETSAQAPRGAKIAAALAGSVFFALILAVIVYALAGA
jgi:hypothetical protein